MNIRNIFVLNLLLLTLLISSCSVMMQRPYIATSPNVNCFEKDNEKNLKLSLFLNHYDVQSNFVLSNKFGLSAGINGGFNGQIGGELAGIFYKIINDKNYFEIQCGYGYFNNKSKISDMPWDFGALIEYGKFFSQDINTNYHKIFIQPTYFYNVKKVNLGFALKISANYIDKYHYYYSTRDNSNGDYDYPDLFSTVDFRYKWSFVFEPVLKIEFNRRLFIQLSGIVSNNIYSSTIYREYNKNPTSTEEYNKLKNPQHINFLFTIGYEFKFGKKKS